MSTELKTYNLVPPKVLEAYGAEGNRLNFNDIYTSTHINVQVPHYVDMLRGHRIRVRRTNGNNNYDTDTQDVGNPAPLNFIIPRLEVIDSIGRLMTVTYSVRLTSETPLIISKSLSLYIDPQDFDLVEPRLSDDKKSVTVKFLNMAPGYTIKVRWHGVVVRETEAKPILSSSSVAFDILANWVTENAGKTVFVNYTVYRIGSNDNLMFSRLLRLTL